MIINRRLFRGRRHRLELGRHLGGHRVRDKGIRIAGGADVDRFIAQADVGSLPQRNKLPLLDELVDLAIGVGDE